MSMCMEWCPYEWEDVEEKRCEYCGKSLVVDRLKYIKYFNYVLRHKWYVMIECFKVGLYWRGLVHDLSKFFPSEFIPYAQWFYGKYGCGYGNEQDEDNKHKRCKNAFDFAWLLHQKRNRHHWQFWLLPEDEGCLKILEMKNPFNLEMLCDWMGAGKAQGHFSPPDDKYFETRGWYKKNKYKIQLHPYTRKWIEEKIGYAIWV